MSLVNLPGDMWDRGQFFAFASAIQQPADMAESMANGMRGCQPDSANRLALDEIEKAADTLAAAEKTLRRIVADLRAKPSLSLVAAE